MPKPARQISNSEMTMSLPCRYCRYWICINRFTCYLEGQKTENGEAKAHVVESSSMTHRL